MSAKCQGCGAEILFIRTVSRARMPVNAEPVWIRLKPGGYTFVRKDGSFVFGEKAGDADDDQSASFVEAYESHYATCPVGGAFRKPRQRRRPSG